MQRLPIALCVLYLPHLACSTSPGAGREAGSPLDTNVATGGSAAAGSTETGTGGTGGATSTAPSTGTCPSDSVCFHEGRALGLMSGKGWVDVDERATINDPSCGANHDPITYGTPCTTELTWSHPDALCLTGFIPALPNSPVIIEYDEIWGMLVGVDARDPNDSIGAALSAFKTIAFTFSGEPQRGVRAWVHRKGDPSSTTYCYESIAPGKALDLMKFNTMCWGDTSTVYLSAADLPTIDQVGILVSSATIDVNASNFCLERISFR